MIVLLLCYFAGAVTVLIIEAAFVLYALNRLSRKQKPEPLVQEEEALVPDSALDHSVVSLLNKKGVIWVLKPDKVPKVYLSESNPKAPREEKSKRENFEVAPARHFARIEGQTLILRDPEGSQSSIQLHGCAVAAVSAGSLSTRKWAKRYPIRLENKNSAVYNGSKVCYIYVETSWEKESWCRALRIASRADKENLRWYMKISQEFRHYVTSLNSEYPFFSKPSVLLTEPADKAQKIDGSSKVRLFLKKLAKKASKVSSDSRTGIASVVTSEEKRSSNKLGATQDTTSSGVSVKAYSADKNSSSFLQRDLSLPVRFDTGAHDQASVYPDMEHDPGASSGIEGCQEKLIIDEGTLCWNLLFSRLFFDAKRSQELANFIQARIQKTLSNMTTPSFIRGVACSKLDLGNLPPYVHHMRVLPMDMNDVWTMEVDIEYSGGAVLNIETRLEVGALDFQKGIIGAGLEPNSEADANTELLEGLELLGNQLELSQDASDTSKKGNEYDKKDGNKSSKSTNWKSSYVSRLKSRLSSFADQVSQVPLSLAVKVALLRGTVRIHVKPPPSDQVWFGFTTMPQVEWDLDSHVGEHRITNGQIALLISKRIKAALKDSMVLPNCECIHIPWMLAEKDDWVPRDVAPFIWRHQESSDSTRNDAPDIQLDGAKSRLESGNGSKQGSGRHPEDSAEISEVDSLDYQLGKVRSRQESGKGSTESSINYHPTDDAEKLESVGSSQTSNCEASVEALPCLPTIVTSSGSEQSVHEDAADELKIPLLKREDSQDSYATSSTELDFSDGSGAIARPTKEYSTNYMAESDKPKKYGRRAKMMDIGKKMGEKLEEKRRHFEEKSRLIVEKMRGNENLN